MALKKCTESLQVYPLIIHWTMKINYKSIQFMQLICDKVVLAFQNLYFPGQSGVVWFGSVDGGAVRQHPCPLIALTESFCLTVTVTENSGKGFTKQNNV